MDLAQKAPNVYQAFQTILKKDRLNHAYLFSGDFANEEMALFLAKVIFCEQKKDQTPCGHCRSCQLIEQGDFADVTVLEPTGQVIKTDVVKEMMANFSQTGYENKRQVFIIKDCDKMHTNAANSLLKYIEEPQGEAYIFLLTNDDNKVLPTIKSRTQVFQFPKNEAYLYQLAQEKGLLNHQAKLVAKLATNTSHLERLLQTSKLLELITQAERFVSIWLKDQLQAYLALNRLVQLATEKEEQDLVLTLLTLLLARERAQTPLTQLEAVYQARLMWQSNVSFQNTLEYMVMSE
ncbi:TPA: DNA polymerase III subunit delta' [Streptococcus pyogenes]|uniref:DNA polymerase III subunit delta' n=1 Tax=Streptococcus pyogenes TaxID=1314 RepID=UPI0003C7D23E|nr:DNA polymerase III subunit delta' [Streptococcus pyogenes]HER4684498.1 DNA polymerase III subunit delta' [Streptococcus pyogenes NGAS353]HER4758801.1 DNA polymerase III subunit delta' [Streptococcus pyogenes NGAS245]ESU88985.1 DNA polymerase III, delta' subunit [Streptococcus pyogenes GA40884]OAC66890.1 DNA polymerase III subunit delta' [Streptococcus pyogenes]OAC78623.1 DNA polymerase III subunit delta' [Streptococcus pyogenes]